MTRRRRAQGFTLIELMIVVAILGILASIAIPGYQRMQLRASAAEGRSNLAGIRTAEESYFVEYNAYAAAAPTPAAVPGIGKTDFPPGGGFALLGWTPDGEVHFQYAVTLPGGASDAYTAEARSDLDGEGTLNLWGYVKQNSVGVGAAGAFGCPASGVWDPAAGAATLQETVGPCDPVSGLSVF